MAPPKWKNREQLWNAVEAAEKTKDSRLAREFVVALPIELDKDSNISLLQNFIQKNFVDKLIEQLKGTFDEYYDYHRRDIAANEVDYLNVEDPDVFSHRAWELEYQRKQEMRRNQPVRTKKKSHDIEL